MAYPSIPRRRPIDLGARRGLSVGDMALAAPMVGMSEKVPQHEQIGAQAEGIATGDAEAMALAEALGADAFRPTEAPGALTGIARVVEILTQHRGNLRERRAEEAEETREEKAEKTRNNAISAALQSFGNPEGMVGALAQGAPEQALDLATVLMRQQAQQEPDEQWSEPYMLNGVTVQRNERTGQVRQAVSRAPQPRAGADGGTAPSLPSGFQWEE